MQIIVEKSQTKFIPILMSSPRKRGSRDQPGTGFPLGPQRSENRRALSIRSGMTGSKVLDIVLSGENASVEVIGLVIGNGSDKKELIANIVHAAPNTKSDVRIKSVLRDNSQFDFRGNVKIEKGAKGSDAYLRSDVLLFDDAKMGDDTPALEILENDVKAGHAATVGKVDEQMIFYLMSRGLTRKQAEEMIVEGFIGEMRDVIASEASNIRKRSEADIAINE